MKGGDYSLCYSPNRQPVTSPELNTLVPVQIRVIGVVSECQGNGCLANERWDAWRDGQTLNPQLAPGALSAEDCFFAYRGEAYSLCQVDFRTFGGGRPGWSVEAGTSSKSAWSALWGSDRYIAGVYQPAERQNCSDVVVGQRLGL